MNLFRMSLSEMARGRASRAAGILVLAHLVPGVAMLALWLIGLAPIFDGGARWILRVIVIVVGLGSILALFIWFGFWGTIASGNQDHGEEYTESFSGGAGYALGWLRWLMQLVAVALVTYIGIGIWVNVRMWNFTGTDELRALQGRFDAIPVPDSWRPDGEIDASGHGLSGIARWPSGDRPNGHVRRYYEVPASYTFDDLKRWMYGPAWATGRGGRTFGAIAVEGCRAAEKSCRARLVPGPGGHPEHFITADLRTGDGGSRPSTVRLNLSYEQYAEPDYEVSAETVARAQAIPVPTTWVRHTDVTEGTTHNGDSFTHWYTAPDDTTDADIRAWLAGPRWTAPTTGTPFGPITVDYCKRDTSGYRCEASVVRTDPSSRPIESISVSMDADRRVRVNLERNG